MWPIPHFPADLVTFSEEILHAKLHYLCSGYRATLQNKLTVIFNSFCFQFSDNSIVFDAINTDGNVWIDYLKQQIFVQAVTAQKMKFSIKDFADVFLGICQKL